MVRESIEYGRSAASYDHRYTVNPLTGVEGALRSLVGLLGAEQILEVGCGSGHWLGFLATQVPRRFGLDLSLEMLRAASLSDPAAGLVRGDSGSPPFAGSRFDLVLCVNALHQFRDAERFVALATALLRPGGALAVVGMDPHRADHRWYLYDYFPGTRKVDLERFPTEKEIRDWMAAAGLSGVESSLVERIDERFIGSEVFEDYFLAKSSTSQLLRLSDTAYTGGLESIGRAVKWAEMTGEAVSFPVRLSLVMVSGRLAKD